MKKPSLKGLDWKQLLVNHGEKLVLGLVVVIGLAAIATSRWAPYREKNPYALIENVEKAKQVHATSTWPEAEQEKFKTDQDISEKAQRLLASLDESQFAFSRSLPAMHWPVIPQQQPIDEPRWYPVEKLLATSGAILYPTAPAYEDLLTAAEDPEAPEAAEERQSPTGRQSSDFLPRPTGGATGAADPYGVGGTTGYTPPGMAPPTGGRGPAAGSRGPGAGGRGPAAAGGRGAGGPGGRGPAAGGRGGGAGGRGAGAGRGAGPGGTPAMGTAGMGMAGMDMTGMGMGYEGGYGMSTGPVEAEAKRYVSVRGVFPIRSQERELARALNAQSTAQVIDALQFVDFELQRQIAVPGDNPWAGPWEKVDLQVANDVLNEAAFFDADVVDPSVTNPVFTMPLPGRLAGSWTEGNASHPSLTKFDLDPAAKEKLEYLNAKIAEYAKQNEELLKDQVQIGGFASQTFDTAKVGRAMMNDPSAMNDLTGGYGGMQRPGARGAGDATTPLTKDEIRQYITASGTYLLFRYVDFDVRPGNAYRYRVRLQVLNPSYGLEAGEVLRNEIAEGQTRWTDWSEPTPPEVVLPDTRYFLTTVEPGGARASDRARFELFQWSDEIGMVVSSYLPVETAQFIGGTTSADVIDPAANTFEPRDFDFSSGDMLVDIVKPPTGLERAHQELALGRNFQLPEQVLVVNDWGGLEVQDPISTAGERVARENFQKTMATEYDYLKTPVTTGEGELGYEGDPAAAMGAGRGGGGRGGAGGRSNPLRRRGSGGGGFSGPPGMSGGP